MRLIDADDLIEVIDAALKEKIGEAGLEEIMRMTILTDFARTVIRDAPAIDAVPVVRCQNCRFYRFYDGAFGKGWICFENNTARHGDDYCSRGERKEDEDRTASG